VSRADLPHSHLSYNLFLSSRRGSRVIADSLNQSGLLCCTVPRVSLANSVKPDLMDAHFSSRVPSSFHLAVAAETSQS
jgi:hypothetical protein